MTQRRAVVTGASSGIGQATVRLLVQHGWHVVGVARRADRLAALAAELGIETFVADVTKQADVDTLRDYLVKTGPVHALVNNAGGAFGSATVEEANIDDWQRMYDVNVLGMQRVTSALLPLLRKAAAAGHADIMTVTSTAGFISYEGGGGYNAAKAAAHAVVGALRLELAGEPIRVSRSRQEWSRQKSSPLNRFAGDAAKYDAVYAGVEAPLLAIDVAEAIVHALELPGHVNLDLITIRPVAQAAAHKLIRGPLKPKD